MRTKKKIIIAVIVAEAVIIAAVIIFLFYKNSGTMKAGCRIGLPAVNLEEYVSDAAAAQENFWKQAFIDYIQQHEDQNYGYVLFYMDSDEIPELLVRNCDEYQECYIVTADNDTGVFHEFPIPFQGSMSWDISCIEYQNFLIISSGTPMGAGHVYNRIYMINNQEVELVGEAQSHGIDPDNFGLGWNYWWKENGEELLEEVYWKSSVEISEEEFGRRVREGESRTYLIDFGMSGETDSQMLQTIESY